MTCTSLKTSILHRVVKRLFQSEFIKLFHKSTQKRIKHRLSYFKAVSADKCLFLKGGYYGLSGAEIEKVEKKREHEEDGA